MRISDWSSDVCSSDLACNQYVDAMAPWALRKTDPERMRAVLMTLFRAVRTLAIAIRPLVPSAADTLLDQMGIASDARAFAALDDVDWFINIVSSGFNIGPPVPLFPLPKLTLWEGEY